MQYRLRVRTLKSGNQRPSQIQKKPPFACSEPHDALQMASCTFEANA